MSNRAKGVKVDLGIPHEMWDKPPAEVTQLKTQVNTYLLLKFYVVLPLQKFYISHSVNIY